MDFYDVQSNRLKALLEARPQTLNVVVLGALGLGKSRVILDVTKNSNFRIISFDKEFRPPFSYIKQGGLEHKNVAREDIVEDLSQSYMKYDGIIYENFENCDMDSMELIKQVIHFHQEIGLPAISIIEWNGEELHDYVEFHDLEYIIFSSLEAPEIGAYIKTIIKAKNQKQMDYLCKRLIQIADGNMLALQLALNVLQQMEVLTKSSDDSKYFYSGKEFKDCLLFLYMDLFNSLNTQVQEALRTIAPFEDNIYISIFKNAFSKCKMIDKYLDEISKYHSFVIRKTAVYESSVPDQINYAFTVEEAKNAVTELTSEEYFYKITTQLYQHLEALYKKANFSKDTVVYLLTLLTKIRHRNLTINHLDYFVKLMEYYNEQSSYRAVICQAERFLNVNILSLIQINLEQPQFFRLYFKALLAVGRYDTIISYLDKLPDWDIKLLIAYAYYNNGNPQRALGLCKELELQHACGEIYSLEASIYDWLGASRQSVSAFKKALMFTHNNEPLKYLLFKKYSLYVDFELEECKNHLNSALQYYEKTSKRQYAETLHNYGTDSIITFSDEGIIHLEKAKHIFIQICKKEVYYPNNSIAIYHCFRGEYIKGIKIWEKIDAQHIEIDFCRLAIQNNLFCAYIKNNDLDLADNIKESLTLQLEFLNPFENPGKIADQRPDIQHQVRQFLLNCALLDLAQDNSSSALNYLMLALECSKYHSTMLYLIQNQVNQLQKKIHTTLLDAMLQKIRNKKLGVPGTLAKFFAQNQMYFCIIMFWGDY